MNKRHVKKISDSTEPFALHAHLLCFLIMTARHFPGMNSQSQNKRADEKR